MDLARHCTLCDNQKISLKEGTTCGLTNRKPEFYKTCSKIELNEKFENKLKTVNIEYDKIKRRKVLTYIHSGVFVTFGFALIICGYLLGKYFLDGQIISEGPMSIMGMGLIPLGIAYRILKEHRKKFEIVKIKKDKIDDVLKEYRIEYDIDITYEKEIHGIQKVSAELKINEIS